MPLGEALIRQMNETSPSPGSLAFWWLGQLGYAIKLGEYTLYVDAYLTDRPDRQVPPVLRPEQVTNADFVFGTHDHEDHIDRPAWRVIAKASPKARFVVSRAHVRMLTDELGIDPKRVVGVGEGKTRVGKLWVAGVPAMHEFFDRDAQGNYPHMGYVVEDGRVRFYHAGDTCRYDGMAATLRALGALDVMFVPINGRDAARYRANIIGNMTYQEAVDLVGEVRPALAVPGHYDMFAFNSEDPDRFADYLDAKYPGMRCWIGERGERVIVGARA